MLLWIYCMAIDSSDWYFRESQSPNIICKRFPVPNTPCNIMLEHHSVFCLVNEFTMAANYWRLQETGCAQTSSIIISNWSVKTKHRPPQLDFTTQLCFVWSTCYHKWLTLIIARNVHEPHLTSYPTDMCSQNIGCNKSSKQHSVFYFVDERECE